MTVSRTAFAILILIAISSRLPFIVAGYGTDPDAWRVAQVATHLWQTGEYEPSRPPGYPLHEAVTAPLASMGGAPLSNTATLLCTIVLLVVWHRIALRESHHPAILVIVLAFTPLFWKNSAATMDYIWSLLFILLALDQGLRGRALWAGITLGIAAGFRPGNMMLIVPLGVLLWVNARSWRSIALFTIAAVAAAAVVFVPVVLAQGFPAWIAEASGQVARIRSSQDTGLLVAGYRSVYAFGPLAAMYVTWLVIRNRAAIAYALRRTDPLIIAALASAVVMGFQFILLPMEREYLLPLLPFGLLALDRCVTRRALIVLGVLLVSYAVVNPDLVEHSGLIGRIRPGVRAGVMIEEWEKHHARERTREAILSLHPPRPAVVMTGFPNAFWFGEQRIVPDSLPVHEPVYTNRNDAGTHHVLCLSREELDRVRSLGYDVYVLDGAQRFVEQTGAYSLEDARVPAITP